MDNMEQPSNEKLIANRSFQMQNDSYSYEKIEEIAGWLMERTDIRPKIGLICGTGMGGVADLLTDTKCFNYENIPHFPKSTVEGHTGRLLFGYMNGVQVFCMQGRFHYFEGYPLWMCSMPVRVMKLIGISHLILSNAAGGLHPSFKEGDIMIIKDHINLMGFAGNGPLIGSNDERFGPRFPSSTEAYDPELIEAAKKIALEIGMDEMREGVYSAVGGPNFETVAELRMLKMIGVDAIGMSTISEVITASHTGIRVFGFSLITNICSTDYETKANPKHEEVLNTGKRKERLVKLWVQKLVQYVNDLIFEKSSLEQNGTNHK